MIRVPSLLHKHRAGVYSLDETLHPTYWTGQTAVELIQNYQLDQPLFLKVSLAQPPRPAVTLSRFVFGS